MIVFIFFNDFHNTAASEWWTYRKMMISLNLINMLQ